MDNRAPRNRQHEFPPPTDVGKQASRVLDNGSSPQRDETVGILTSGGLDSCILLGHLLHAGRRVKSFYVRSGLYWQKAELTALQRYLAAMPRQRLEPLTVLELPLADIYDDHWSITGDNVPGSDTPDEAVFLPGRNVFLIAKAALWCQMHGIDVLALATLKSNPFRDASDAFFQNWQAVLEGVWPHAIRLARPFGKFEKRRVMELGRDYPLELTFSCISPDNDGRHCGQCNKCAERQDAFRAGGLDDPTVYADALCYAP